MSGGLRASCFCSWPPSRGQRARLTFVLINKRVAKHASVTLELSKAVPEQQVALYEYSNADRFAIGRLPARKVSGRSIAIDLPAFSAIRFDLKP